MPEADGGHRNLAAGETAIVFLTVVLEPRAAVPDRLSHRLLTGDGNIDGAFATLHDTTAEATARLSYAHDRKLLAKAPVPT